MSALDPHPFVPVGTFVLIALGIGFLAWIILGIRDAHRQREQMWDPNMGTCDGCTKRCNRYRLARVESERGVRYYCPRCAEELRGLLRRSA